MLAWGILLEQVMEDVSDVISHIRIDVSVLTVVVIVVHAWDYLVTIRHIPPDVLGEDEALWIRGGVTVVRHPDVRMTVLERVE